MHHAIQLAALQLPRLRQAVFGPPPDPNFLSNVLDRDAPRHTAASSVPRASNAPIDGKLMWWSCKSNFFLWPATYWSPWLGDCMKTMAIPASFRSSAFTRALFLSQVSASLFWNWKRNLSLGSTRSILAFDSWSLSLCFFLSRTSSWSYRARATCFFLLKLRG